MSDYNWTLTMQLRILRRKVLDKNSRRTYDTLQQKEVLKKRNGNHIKDIRWADIEIIKELK